MKRGVTAAGATHAGWTLLQAYRLKKDDAPTLNFLAQALAITAIQAGKSAAEVAALLQPEPEKTPP